MSFPSTVADLKKHGILKNLCKNKDITKIATRQRKRHSSLDRTVYDTGVLNNHHSSRREITTFSQGFKKKRPIRSRGIWCYYIRVDDSLLEYTCTASPRWTNRGRPMPRPLFVWLALPLGQFGQIFELNFWDLAVDYITKGNPGIKLSAFDLKRLFLWMYLRPLKHISFLTVRITIRLMV